MAIEPHNNNRLFQELLDNLKEQGNNFNHENLQGLLGGNASGHFHVTKEQLQLIDNISSGGGNHENLTGLLGGDASGHHHLTLDELNKIKAYPAYSSLNHENLQGLLGGNSSGRYHLTVDLLNKLINLPAGGTSNVTIIDNLSSSRNDAALSANQGKVLNEKLSVLSSESWTFTLDDNSTVTKKVVLSA